MSARHIKLQFLIPILLISILLWQMAPPTGLEVKAWHLFIVFLSTILGIVTSAMPLGVVTMFSVTVLVLTNTLSLKEALSGFSSSVVWLVIVAFFIARGFIKTNLGRRIAYYLISRFGHTNIGLSYSLIFTEFILAPMTPSTAARGGGIIYPIAKSLADEFDKVKGSMSKTGAFLIATCFHCNVICCASFATAIAGNPLLLGMIQKEGIDLTWTKWAIATIVPAIINLILLPFLTSFLIKPEHFNNEEIVARAKESLIEMGSFSRNEIIMLLTFILMLTLWIFGEKIGIDATTAGLIGFLILVITNAITWDEVVSEKAAWETMIWFAILVMLAGALDNLGVDDWLEHNVKHFLGDLKGLSLIVALVLIYYYSHYFFASTIAHITVLFMTFLLILIDAGVPPLVSAMALAVFSNLSASLTHYGISTAPIYFGAHYFSTKNWMKVGLVVATFNLILWVILGGTWWKILGWW